MGSSAIAIAVLSPARWQCTDSLLRAASELPFHICQLSAQRCCPLQPCSLQLSFDGLARPPYRSLHLGLCWLLCSSARIRASFLLGDGRPLSSNIRLRLTQQLPSALALSNAGVAPGYCSLELLFIPGRIGLSFVETPSSVETRS